MADTDNTSETAKILRELSNASLSRPRKVLGSLSPNQRGQPRQSSSNHDLPTISSIDPNDENLMMSTQHNFDDSSHALTKLRSTAQRYGYYNPPEPQPNIPTSAVNRAFRDFDQDMTSEEEEIELGRGYRGVSRGTPSKLGGSDVLLQLNDSFYQDAGTPQSRPKTRTRRSEGAERGSLRRDAVMRKASTAAPGALRVSPRKIASGGTRVTSLTDAYTKVKAGDGLTDTINPGDLTGYGRASSEPPPDVNSAAMFTPRKQPQYQGTPRSAGNATVASFALPDITHLTDIIFNGTYSRVNSAKASSRFADPTGRRTVSNFVGIRQVPVPEDEKLILESLQKVQEKIMDLERERNTVQARAHQLEDQVLELKKAAEVRDQLRRTDSGLGGVDDEKGAKSRVKWQMEKTKYEASIRTLQSRIATFETRTKDAETLIRRLTEERNGALAQVAHDGQEAQHIDDEYDQLQEDYEVLNEDYKRLQQDNEVLRAENERLASQLEQSHIRHEKAHERQQKLTTMASSRTFDEANLALTSENQRLTTQLAEAKQSNAQELRRWKKQADNLKAQVEEKDETIQTLAKLQDKLVAAAIPTQDRLNPQTRVNSKITRTMGVIELREQLETVIEQHREDSRRWREQEAILQAQLEVLTTRSTTTVKSSGVSKAASASKSRSRSRSRVRQSQVSAQVQNAAEARYEAESTTDLNLDRPRPHVAQHHRSASATNGAAIPFSRHEEDMTELTNIADLEIANLRRRLEEERRARHAARKGTTSAEAAPVLRPTLRENRNATVEDHNADESDASIPAPSDASSEDLDNSAVIDESTRRSSGSRTRRRRSSAASFKDMTSAFIIPDITLRATSKSRRPSSTMAKDAATTHDAATCNICQQLEGNSNLELFKLHPVLPISLRADIATDPDATSRPTQSPISALAVVLKSLYDEHAHYHILLRTAQHELEHLDPAASKRKHDNYHTQITRLNALIKAKSQQIYDLFDVVEAHRENLGDVDTNTVDRVLEEIRNTKQQKKVGFEKDLTVESGITWEGLSEVSSLDRA